MTYVIGYSPFVSLASIRKRCIMHKSQHYLDYDPVALGVLFAGLSIVGLFLFI